MASRKQRVTNAHRAGVCGLVIVGVGFVQACRIMGIPYGLVKESLGGGWDGRHSCNKKKRWEGALLAEAKAFYCDLNLTTEQIGAMYGVKRDTLWKLAKKHKWPKRCLGGKLALPTPISKMEPHLAARYRKLQKVIGSDAARKAVFG